MCLPIITMSIGGFASLTMLTKNSFLEEINKQYVTTAKAKGLATKDILYKHVFRNARITSYNVCYTKLLRSYDP